MLSWSNIRDRLNCCPGDSDVDLEEAEELELLDDEGRMLTVYDFDEKAQSDVEKLSEIDALYHKTKGHYYETMPGLSSDPYVHLTKIKPNMGDNELAKTGWKLHLSIRKDDLEQAWPIIVSNLIEYGVHHSKCRKLITAHTFQPGKEIVIYQFSSNPKLNWNALINTIESQLIEKGIRPGDMPCYRAASDKGKLCT